MKMCRETLTVGQKRGRCREVTHMDRWLLVEFWQYLGLLKFSSYTTTLVDKGYCVITNILNAFDYAERVKEHYCLSDDCH